MGGACGISRVDLSHGRDFGNFQAELESSRVVTGLAIATAGESQGGSRAWRSSGNARGCTSWQGWEMLRESTGGRGWGMSRVCASHMGGLLRI
jgi:hypothetical protein